jgi:hypothetical protein
MQVVVFPLAALAVGWLLVVIAFARVHQILVIDNDASIE